MMNEIFLRTNKCEYSPGENIYGYIRLIQYIGHCIFNKTRNLQNVNSYDF